MLPLSMLLTLLLCRCAQVERLARSEPWVLKEMAPARAAAQLVAAVARLTRGAAGALSTTVREDVRKLKQVRGAQSRAHAQPALERLARTVTAQQTQQPTFKATALQLSLSPPSPSPAVCMQGCCWCSGDNLLPAHAYHPTPRADQES